MANPVFVAVGAGVAMGIVVGYRLSRIVVQKVGHPFERTKLVLGCATAGGVFIMIPAIMVSILYGLSLTQRSPGAATAVAESLSTEALVGVAAGMALVNGSSLIVGCFAGALCARIICQARSLQR